MVEIRDVKSNSVIKAIEDFAAGPEPNYPKGLSFSHELLAVGGRRDKPNKKQVRLYSISGLRSGSEDFKALELPRGMYCVKFNHAGTKLAVGMHSPADLSVYSSENDWSDPPLRLLPRIRRA